MYTYIHVLTCVDMEWLIGSDGANEVDIGYCSLLRVYSEAPSQAWDSNGELMTVNNNTLHWTEEITLNSAQSIIEKHFYPFKEVSFSTLCVSGCVTYVLLEVPYLPFLDAVSLAKSSAKLVHLIMLWGALDDQSC